MIVVKPQDKRVMTKRVLGFVVGFAILGCTFNAWYGDFDKQKSLFESVPLHRLSIGYTKKQVEEALGAPPSVVGAKRFPDGIVEVWEYQQWKAVPGPDRIYQRHWIYFLNGEVFQWGRPGDWEKEADRIYEIRLR